MAKHRSKKLLAFGDVHIPAHSPRAVEVFCRAAEKIRPDIIVCLGDLLDCSQFSTHPPTWGVRTTDYEDDVATAKALLARLRATTQRLVILEGNHEYRIERWAAATQVGRSAYSMLSPRKALTHRTDYQWIPYGSATGRYPHYRVNRRLVAVHGWSYAKAAGRIHLLAAQGKSIIYGHTHRAESVTVQDIWSRNGIIEARNGGCLCRRVPLYGVGNPVEWTHGFVLGFLGRRSDTLYSIPIMGNRCILPDGTEIAG